MENEFDGTLFFKGEGKKRRLYLKFTTRNDKNWENPIGENILSASLKQFAKEEKGEVEKTVKLREQGGRPISVYLEGETVVNKPETAPVDYSKKSSVPSSGKSGFSKPKDFESGKSKGENIDMQPEFHNPYNFVPAIPRDKVNKLKDANGEIHDLGDKPPIGHDRFYPNHLSGKLTVKMTVKTPLLVLDTARISVEELKDNKIHKKYPVRLVDGKPYVEPTAIKGMLRSAYEAITNSRMSVFNKHEDKLALRSDSSKGASVVPVRIEEENGSKKIVFYTGTNEVENLDENGVPNQGESSCAAWLPRYKENGNDKIIKYKDGNSPEHGDEVEVWVEKFRHYKWDEKNQRLNKRSNFAFWRVREIVKKGEKLGNEPNPTSNIGLDVAEKLGKSYYESTGEVKSASGYVFVSNHNMQNKHDEKVFFKNNKSPKPEILSPERWKELKDEWRNLIENYQELHKDEDKPPRTLHIKQWSRHIYKKNKVEILKPDMLCYASVSKNGAGFKVEHLFPVMISRQLYDKSPEYLLPKELHPAKLITQLSPADRVFGWVRQNKLKDKDLSNKEKSPFKEIENIGAYRGQIRFGEVTTKRTDAIEDFGEDWLPLNILGQPKPQQGRFYVARNQKGKAQPKNLSNEQAGYSEETEYPPNLLINNQKEKKGLRGRKVYPHQNSLPDSYWIVENDLKEPPSQPFSEQELQRNGGKKFFREYIRLRGEKQRDNQNRSLQGWVRKDTEFEFDIHFTNLSEIELGALVWLLSLNGENEDKYFHRLGGGKPFGFGSVKLELRENEVFKGNELKKFYLSLGEEKEEDKPQPTNAKTLTKTFQQAVLYAYKPEAKATDEQVGAEFEKVSFIAAFKRACEGFKDKDNDKTNLPAHYPRRTKESYRTKPNGAKEVSESFKWFVENNKSLKLSLPDLIEDDGLPYLK